MKLIDSKRKMECEFPYSKSKMYMARFMGYTKYTHSKVEKELELVEDLIKWAIINQVMFTHQYLRKGISKEKEANVSEKPGTDRNGDCISNNNLNNKHLQNRTTIPKLNLGGNAPAMRWNNLIQLTRNVV